mgnify:FL=1
MKNNRVVIRSKDEYNGLVGRIVKPVREIAGVVAVSFCEHDLEGSGVDLPGRGLGLRYNLPDTLLRPFKESEVEIIK